MQPFKEKSRNDQIYKLLSLTPLTVKEIADTLGMSLSNVATCLAVIKTKGLARRVMFQDKPLGWVRKNDVKPKRATKPKAIDKPPVTASLVPAVSNVNHSLDTSNAINVMIQTEQQNINYRHTLQQILSVYEQLGTVLEAAGLLEE